MSDDPDLKMFEIKSGLEEIKEEMEMIKKENTDLKNNMAFNNLMEKVDNFQREYSKTLEIIQEKIGTLTTTISSNDQILSKVNETVEKQDEILKQQNGVIDVLKKNVKAMGGKGGKKLIDSLLILQDNGENDGNWKQLNIKLPHAVWCHGAQFLDNYLYIFGGQNEKNEVLNLSYKLTRGHKWITNSLQWEKITDMNEKRDCISNSSVILNDRIWAIGGCNKEKGALRSVEMYDPQTNIWTNMKEMNECRGLSAAAVVRGKIFCCGGSNGCNFLKSAECYDFFSDVWTLISDMPGPNTGCCVVVMDAHLIVIGGINSEENFLNSVWVLDTTDEDAKWIEKEPRLSRPLCEFSVAKIDDKIFVCGGLYIDQKNSKRCTSNGVEIFDGQVWRNGSKLTTLQHSAAAVVIPMEFARDLEQVTTVHIE